MAKVHNKGFKTKAWGQGPQDIGFRTKPQDISCRTELQDEESEHSFRTKIQEQKTSGRRIKDKGSMTKLVDRAEEEGFRTKIQDIGFSAKPQDRASGQRFRTLPDKASGRSLRTTLENTASG